MRLPCLPQLIITRNTSYVSILPLMRNGWLAGHPNAREDRLTHLQRYALQMPGLEQHYASVSERNARTFGTKMLEAGAQVVLDLMTYPDPDQAGRILLRMLMGVHEHSSPCIIVLMEANKWVPNDTWLLQGYGIVSDLQLARQIRAYVGQVMSAEKNTVYLSTNSLMSMDLRLARICSLWTLNMAPSEEDKLFITHHTGILEQDLACLNRHSIITDTTTRTAMEVALHSHQSTHEEASRERNPSSQLLDLSMVVGEEAASLGKSRAEEGNREVEDKQKAQPSSATAGRPPRQFTKQQLAFGIALQAADQLSQTALRRPPTTKTIGNTQITFADLAQELRLKNAFSDKDLLGQDRAEELQKTVENLTEDERHECEKEVQAALSAIAERRGYTNPPVSLTLESPNITPGVSSRWPTPGTELFKRVTPVQTVTREEVWAMAHKIQAVLNGQKVHAEVLEEYINIGSTVLQFGILPTGIPLKDGEGRIARDTSGAIIYDKETKISDITKLKKDLMARLQAKKILLLDPVPGTPFVGVQIPNPLPTPVLIRDVLEDPDYLRARMKSKLVIALGRDVSGRVRFLDLEKPSNPHLLVAGSTGGGKSVCLNSIIASILTRATPDDVRMIMIDPKRVELKFYSGIPHVIGDVITEPEKAIEAFQRAVDEMERRYKRFEELEVRDMAGYRRLRAEALANGETLLDNIPSIVVVVDELANLMMKVGDLVEELICKIAALGRAAGIHLVLATQRPTVNVITGEIKANIPARIAFLVGSAIDSTTILGRSGAEALQGKGDMLFDSPETEAPERIQCALTEDQEAKNLATYWKKAQPLIGEASEWQQPPLDQHWAEAAARETQASLQSFAPQESDDDDEAYLERAKDLIQVEGKASISLLQRRLRIGYTKAARLIDLLEEQGFIGPEVKGGKSRAILPDIPSSADQQEDQGEQSVSEEHDQLASIDAITH